MLGLDVCHVRLDMLFQAYHTGEYDPSVKSQLAVHDQFQGLTWNTPPGIGGARASRHCSREARPPPLGRSLLMYALDSICACYALTQHAHVEACDVLRRSEARRGAS